MCVSYPSIKANAGFAILFAAINKRKELNIKRRKMIGVKKFLCYTLRTRFVARKDKQSRRTAMAGNGSSRRSFVKLLAAAPLLSQIAARELYARTSTAIGMWAEQNVYSRLGVKTVINCRGTWTYLSGSLELDRERWGE